MDALDRLAGPARDLLSRVDATLVRAGAPADHPLWPLLRRLRVLPGDAVAAVAALRPAPLAGAGPALRELSRRYAQPRGTPPDWQGPAAGAFAAGWTTLSRYVEVDLAGRLADTASYAEAVVEWVGHTRLAVARALATAMTSAEAVTMGSGDDPIRVVRAAADIAVRVLGAVAEAYAQADGLLAAWPGRLGESPFTPPSAVPAGSGEAGTLDIPR